MRPNCQFGRARFLGHQTQVQQNREPGFFRNDFFVNLKNESGVQHVSALRERLDDVAMLVDDCPSCGNDCATI